MSNQYAQNEGQGGFRQNEGQGGYRQNEGQGGFRRFISHPRECQFCTDKNAQIDYKQADVLRRYVSEDGKIRPRRQTGACAKHQRALARAIKRARQIALLPYSGEVLR